MEKEFHNHMRIPWHDHTRKSIGRPITEASLSEKARSSVVLELCFYLAELEHGEYEVL